MSSTEPSLPRRQRLTREERQRQLIETAWRIVGEEGTDALTLGHLAEWAGVTKPVVYSHFPTRSALLIALYRDFDMREYAVMEAALESSEASLAGKAGAIASSYVDCVLAQGREIPGVMAALAGSPELAAVKRDCDLIFLEKCRGLLAPFAAGRTIPTAGLRAMLGAAEALSHAAATQEIGADEAKRELFETIAAMVARSARG
jgi:AcrR family transcriptional regulator